MFTGGEEEDGGDGDPEGMFEPGEGGIVCSEDSLGQIKAAQGVIEGGEEVGGEEEFAALVGGEEGEGGEDVEVGGGVVGGEVEDEGGQGHLGEDEGIAEGVFVGEEEE